MIQVGNKETISLQETDRTRNGVREEFIGPGEPRGVRKCCFARPARLVFFAGLVFDQEYVAATPEGDQVLPRVMC